MNNSGTIKIGTANAQRGTRSQGFLEIGETAASAVRIPVAIINGAKEGPVLCLTAGVHATEYAPIDAVMRLIQKLSPTSLVGAVIAVPVVNMPMYAARSGFVSPIDGLNLNKIAPGGQGSLSEILVRALLDEIIAKSSHYIDLHAGDLGEMLFPFAGYSLTGDAALDVEGEAMARLFTPGLISLSVEGSTLPPFPGSIVHAATRRGVVSILAESGGNGTLEEADVELHLDGVLNIMRYLKMIDGIPSVPGPQITATDRTVTRAGRSGLLRLKVAIGDKVSGGQEVAEVCDVFGQSVETVRVNRGGIAGLIWAHKVVSTGDPIVRCWHTAPAAAFPLTDRFLRASS